MLWSVKGRNAAVSNENPRRIDAVKPPLVTGIEALPNGTPLTLIEFSTGVRSVKDFVLDRPETREAAIRWVRDLSPDPRGDTHLWAATQRSFEVVRGYLALAKSKNLTARVLVRIYTDGENDDKSPESAHLTLQQVLSEFPEIDGRALRPDLVLMGPDLKMETEAVLRTEPRIRVIRDPELVLPFPPVIVWRPDPLATNQKASFLENSRSLYREYSWSLDGVAVSREKVLDVPSLTAGTHSVRLDVTHEGGLQDFSEETFTVVNPPSPLPEASFSLLPDLIVKPGTEVTAKADTTQPGWKHLWKVTGNPEQSGETIRWTVTEPGRIEVVHEVSNESGKRTYRQMLVCEAPELPVPEFEVPGGIDFLPGETVEFRASETRPEWKHEWKIGANQVMEGPVASVLLSDPNPIEVIHRVSSAGGSREEKMMLQPIMPTLSATPVYGKIPLKVSFSVDPGSFRSAIWDFGQEPVEGGTVMEREFPEAGEHRITVLSVETSRGQRVTLPVGSASVVVSAAKPWCDGACMKKYGSIFGLIALLASALLVWKRTRPRPLFGTLEWTFGTETGSLTLIGKKRLSLKEIRPIAEAGWSPKHPYILVNKGRPGLFHIVGGPRIYDLKKGQAVGIEGLTLIRPAT